MRINTDLIKRWFKSTSNKIWLAMASLAEIYRNLSPEDQLALYNMIKPYLPSAPVLVIIISFVGMALRAKTKTPISER